MITNTDVLKLLQDAWQVLPTKSLDVEKQPENEPKQSTDFLLTGKTEPCRFHVHPYDLLDEPDEQRCDYVRSHCRHCRKFLGYRRSE